MMTNQQILKKWKPVNHESLSYPAAQLARYLLGHILVHQTDQGVTAGRIVETEAYLGMEDAAAHAYRGESERTRALFGPAGYSYIYLSYGIHYCFNVTAGMPGDGQGVLIRALEPVAGIGLMQQRRGLPVRTDSSDADATPSIMLTNGPGKLVQAMGIHKGLYGHDLTQPPLYLSVGSVSDDQVKVGPRIGISKAAELPLRYWVKGSMFVSKLNKRDI